MKYHVYDRAGIRRFSGGEGNACFNLLLGESVYYPSRVY